MLVAPHVLLAHSSWIELHAHGAKYDFCISIRFSSFFLVNSLVFVFSSLHALSTVRVINRLWYKMSDAANRMTCNASESNERICFQSLHFGWRMFTPWNISIGMHDWMPQWKFTADYDAYVFSYSFSGLDWIWHSRKHTCTIYSRCHLKPLGLEWQQSPRLQELFFLLFD